MELRLPYGCTQVSDTRVNTYGVEHTRAHTCAHTCSWQLRTYMKPWTRASLHSEPKQTIKELQIVQEGGNPSRARWGDFQAERILLERIKASRPAI